MITSSHGENNDGIELEMWKALVWRVGLVYVAGAGTVR